MGRGTFIALVALVASMAAGCASAPSPKSLATRGVQLPSLARGDEWASFYSGSYALLLGVSDYADGLGWRDLPGVREDLEAVKAGLQRHGFVVTQVLDPTRERMDRAISDFISAHGQPLNHRLLIWFAGHGYTSRTSWGDTTGYIIPADTPSPSTDRAGFRAHAVDMQMMKIHARAIDAKHVLFVFDSCFAGTVFDSTRAPPAHITDRTSKHVRQFIAAGGADQEVPDHSIFREQFLAGIDGDADVDKDGYVTGTELGDHLYKTVVSYSNRTQTPQSGKLRHPRLNKGDFVFVAGGTPPSSSSGGSAGAVGREGFDLSDLQDEARALFEVHEALQAHLIEMESAYHAASDLEAGPLPDSKKAEAWRRFLEYFADDLPAAQQDDEMREEGARRLAALTGRAEDRTCTYGDAPDCARQCTGGHGPSCLVLGKMYADGGGENVDDEAALRRFEQACDAGVAQGCVALAWMYDKGWGAKQDYSRAEALYRGACEAGEADGCAGLLYVLSRAGANRSVMSDEEVTVGARAACEGGSARGCANLGVRLLRGWGTATDPVEASKRFARACDLGSAGGCSLLASQYLKGEGVEEDLHRALALYEDACAGGRMSGASAGCRGLAYLYLSGTAVKKDEARGKELLARSCADRDAGACAELAVLLSETGDKNDAEESVRIGQHACDMNSGLACFALGKRYRRGTGVVRDRRKAVQLLARGCSLGHGPACLMAGRMAGSPEDTARLLDAACDSETLPRCLEAAWGFEHGEGVSADPGRALRCYSRACELEEATGCEGAGRLLVQADRSPEDQARGLDLLQAACKDGASSACDLCSELAP